MKSTKVSVIIPAFNQADYLRTALDSALTQTHENLEILVIDDGSTDNTRQVAEHYAKHDSRVFYTYQNNDKTFGLGARNWGMLNATGEWIALLDQDDIWYPTKIEDQLNFANQHAGAECVFCPVDFIDSNGKLINSQSDPRLNVYEYENFLSENRIYVSSGIFKRKLLSKAGLPNESSGYADWWLWLSLSKHTKVLRLNKILAAYRIQEASYQQQQLKKDLHKFALDNLLTILNQASRSVITPSLKNTYQKAINARAKLYLRASYKDLAYLDISKFLKAATNSLRFTKGFFYKGSIAIRLLLEAPIKAIILRIKLRKK